MKRGDLIRDEHNEPYRIFRIIRHEKQQIIALAEKINAKRNKLRKIVIESN